MQAVLVAVAVAVAVKAARTAIATTKLFRGLRIKLQTPKINN
jgi:hypothetical protein